MISNFEIRTQSKHIEMRKETTIYQKNSQHSRSHQLDDKSKTMTTFYNPVASNTRTYIACMKYINNGSDSVNQENTI